MTRLPCVLYPCPLTGPVCGRRRRKWLYWPLYKHYINPKGSPPAILRSPPPPSFLTVCLRCSPPDNAPVPSSITTLGPKNNQEITLKAVCSGFGPFHLSSSESDNSERKHGVGRNSTMLRFCFLNYAKLRTGGGVAGGALVDLLSGESGFLQNHVIWLKLKRVCVCVCVCVCVHNAVFSDPSSTGLFLNSLFCLTVSLPMIALPLPLLWAL